MEDQRKEEYAIVLDFLPHGYPFDNRPVHKKTAIAQAVGTSNFTLLELVPKKDIFLQPYERIYIGEGKRDKIHHIIGKLPVSRLTGTARKELQFVIREVVDADERRFVEFFNKAMPLSTRMHMMELLPGVGKKHMWQIIEQRDIKPFESFEDIKNRVKLLPDPKKSVVRRILLELEGQEKYGLFVDIERRPA
jgi:putative nucleotide binding protein